MYVSNLKAGDLYKAELVLAAIHYGDWSWLRLLKSNEGRLAETFLMLDSDSNQINLLVAQHENTPKDILVKLAEVPQDVWDKVLDKIPEAWNANTGVYNVRSNLAWNVNTPKEILRKLSEDKNDSVRGKVAGNKNTPKDILTKLSEENNNLVIANLVRNSNTPKEVLLKIKKAGGGFGEKAAKALEWLAEDEEWLAQNKT